MSIEVCVLTRSKRDLAGIKLTWALFIHTFWYLSIFVMIGLLKKSQECDTADVFLSEAMHFNSPVHGSPQVPASATSTAPTKWRAIRPPASAPVSPASGDRSATAASRASGTSAASWRRTWAAARVRNRRRASLGYVYLCCRVTHDFGGRTARLYARRSPVLSH